MGGLWGLRGGGKGAWPRPGKGWKGGFCGVWVGCLAI